MKKTYSNVRGTRDFNPSQTYLFNKVINIAREIFLKRGYEEIILPVLEEAGLFIRSVGRTTDIVEKQMFKVVRDGWDEKKDIVLRPEATAQVVRYYLQNHLDKQSVFQKFFYVGPMFRGERPQKGRLRQFHHVGAEVIGSGSIEFDAEIIRIALKILEDLGIKDKKLKINSLGCAHDKEKFSKGLESDLGKEKNRLCQDCQRRLETNPLRILDCKKEICKAVVHSLNIGQNHLCEDCKAQFRILLSILDNFGIKYSYEPTLVRGLDYYTNTVFEITSSELGSQDAIGAGGRYNNLIKDLGGSDIPATGFALGIERILLLLKSVKYSQQPNVYFASTSEALRREALKIMEECRDKGVAADAAYAAKSLKAQLRYAQKKEAKTVVIVGDDEWGQGYVIVRDMEKSTQEKIKKEKLFSTLKKGVK